MLSSVFRKGWNSSFFNPFLAHSHTHEWSACWPLDVPPVLAGMIIPALCHTLGFSVSLGRSGTWTAGWVPASDFTLGWRSGLREPSATSFQCLLPQLLPRSLATGSQTAPLDSIPATAVNHSGYLSLSSVQRVGYNCFLPPGVFPDFLCQSAFPITKTHSLYHPHLS